MSKLDSFPILNNSNSRKINPINLRNSVEKSKEVSFKVQEKAQNAPKKREQINNRYFSVGMP